MKSLFCFCLCSLLFGVAVVAQQPANPGFRAVRVDAGKVTGKIRSFQGLNGSPSPIMEGLPDLVHQYKDLEVSQIRTHDFMGPTEIDSVFDVSNSYLAWLIPDSAQRAAVVAAGNASIIFPNPKADPDDPKSYNFGPTDKMIAAIRDSGAEVYYRIGRSWGANTDPPVDFDKYAAVVQHIALHYNNGWADGFHDNIRYWEFWNEPELSWSGTPAQFYSLYEKTARALKAINPKLKVGGDAVAFPHNPGPYREGFIDFCSSHKVPLDFYSWHMYADRSADPYDANRLGDEIRDILDTRDFTGTESILSEWNLSADFTADQKSRLQGPIDAAYIGAVLTYLQDAPIDRAHFYRGDAAWMGLFDLQGGYYKTAHAFQAMAKMQDTPRRLRVKGDDTFGFAVLAGRSADNRTVQVLISNYAIPAGYQPHDMQMPADLRKSAPPPPDFSKVKFLPARKDVVYRDNIGYTLTIDNLPWGGAPYTIQRYRISGIKDLDLIEENSSVGGVASISSPLTPPEVELIVLHRSK